MAIRKTSSARTGAGCLILFALPFAAVGVGVAIWAGTTLLRWYDARDWAPVPAEVLSADLVRHSDDDSTTYEATTTYRYRYEGREYTGTRVGVAAGRADNVGDFQERLYRELESARRNGTPVTVYVDPDAPANAVVSRELRVGMLLLQGVFVLVFGGVGIGLIVGAIFGRKKVAAEDALKEQHPEEPWRWREEWASGRIRSSTRAAAYTAIVFAVIWNAISAPAAALVPGEIAAGNYVATIALLFPLVGIGLAAWAVRSWLQIRRFKVATLTIPAGPVAAGSRLRGTVRVDAEVPVSGEFRLELSCVEERKSGKNSDSSERLVWQREWRVPRHQCQIAPSFTTIPVDVTLPHDQPLTDTSLENDRRTITWRLDVAGECPGPDFWGRFELPVFTRAAAPATGDGDTPAPRPDPSLLDARALAARGIDYRREARGTETWTFRRARHKGVALGLTVFSLIWTVASVALYLVDAPLVMPIVFTLFDVLIVWWTLSLWFTEHRVALDRGLLTITKRGLLPAKTVEVPLQWVRNIAAKRGMQAGNKLYYDLKVETPEGTHTAASSLGDYDLATALAAHWLAARDPQGRQA
jgi:hypothetical protein